MKKKFKFSVVVKNDPIKIVCVDMPEVNFEIKTLLERDPDAVWMIEELDDSHGPFVTWDDYPESVRPYGDV